MDRTPRRGSTIAPHTPGADPNIVSRVGLSASADGRMARGILCLKLAIPKDATGNWPLFSGRAPNLCAIPAIYPVPVTPFLGKGSSNLRAAVALLNLPSKGAYPHTPTDSGIQVRIDETAKGQVVVVVDESPRRNARNNGSATPSRRESLGIRDRAEFVAVLEFEVPVETVQQGTDEFYRTAIPVPKCLDNNLKFQMLGHEECEVSVMAEPKVLPTQHKLRESTDSNPFRSRKDGTSGRRQLEEGWEDGEVPGAESEESSDDDEGSWLEGRFPSTDTLNLQWSFVPSLKSPPVLRVTPNWDGKCPSISMSFEAGIPAVGGRLSLEAVLPPDWGWQELEIRGEQLLSWKSTDEDLASIEAEADDGDVSILTEMPPSPSIRSHPRVVSLDASRLEPLDADELASLDDADFSFADTSIAVGRAPVTPSRRRQVKEAPAGAQFKITPRVPVPAGLFELEFGESTSIADSDDEEQRRLLLIEGTLVPLPRVLVSPDAPVSIPFVRFEKASLPTQCSVRCSNAVFPDDAPSGSGPEFSRFRSTSGTCIGTFAWTDDDGHAVPRRAALPVRGPVRIVVQRNIWGVQTVLVSFNWPLRAAEVSLMFSAPSVRVVSATSKGEELSRTVLPVETGAEVRVAGGRTSLELILEVADDTGVALPSFPAGSGELKVELAGDGWDKLISSQPTTNLKHVTDRGFVGELGVSPPLITFTVPPPPQKWWSRIFSFKAFGILLAFWAFVSIVVQVQLLRNEVAFVAEETRDLRMYSFERDRIERELLKWEQSGTQSDRWGPPASPPQGQAREQDGQPTDRPQVEPVAHEPNSETPSDWLREQDSPDGSHSGHVRYDYDSPPDGGPNKAPLWSKSVDASGEQRLGRVVFGSRWPKWSNHPV